MPRIAKPLALSSLALSLGSLDAIVWFGMHVPFGWDSLNLEVNHTQIPSHLLIRLFITLVLAWTFLYFNAHCVVASREESTKIVMKG